MLEAELGVEPEDQTIGLCEAIRANRLVPSFGNQAEEATTAGGKGISPDRPRSGRTNGSGPARFLALEAGYAFLHSRPRSRYAADCMGPGASDIAEVVPEVREVFSDIEPSPRLEPEQARFRLFDSIGLFLKRLSRIQTMALVLDDLHCADGSSLLLLEFIARETEEARLLIVGTYRDVELLPQNPLAQALGQLARLRSFREIALGGLGRDDVGLLFERYARFEPPGEFVESLYGRTGGSPLFVCEIMRLLEEQGILAPERLRAVGQVTAQIPRMVRVAISRRLGRLSRELQPGSYRRNGDRPGVQSRGARTSGD